MSQAHVSSLYVYACDLFSASGDTPGAIQAARDFLYDLVSHRSDHPSLSDSAYTSLTDALRVLSRDSVFHDFEEREFAAELVRQAARQWALTLSTTFSTFTFQVRVPHFLPIQADSSAPGAPSAGADGGPPAPLGNLVVNSEIGL